MAKQKTKSNTVRINTVDSMVSNPIAIWPNLSRAIEIAKLSGSTVSLYFQKDYKNGFEDYKFIKDFYKGFFDDFVGLGGVIEIELHKPDQYKYYGSYLTLEQIDNSIEGYKKNIIPTELTNSSEILLKTVTDRLNLSIFDVQNLLKLAGFIAQMSNKEIIGAEHIAEASQYIKSSDFDVNEVVFAETGNFVFGFFGSNDIVIKPTEIEEEVIDKAIEFLMSLKNNICHSTKK